jgi:hypothetical protein
MLFNEEYISYQEFNSTNNDYKDEEYEEYEDLDDGIKTIDYIAVLSLISKWFIRIGIFIAAVLILIFLFTFKIKTLLYYVMGLVLAFFFGYFFMFCLDKLISRN